MKTPWPAKTPCTCASGLRRGALSPGPRGSGGSHRPASPAPAMPCEERCQHHSLRGGDPRAPGDGLPCPHRGGAGATWLLPRFKANASPCPLGTARSPSNYNGLPRATLWGGGEVFNHCPPEVHLTAPGPRRPVIWTRSWDRDRGHGAAQSDCPRSSPPYAH